MVHSANTPSSLNNFVQVPDIQTIEAMDQAKQQAINSLELIADGQYVKCQKCGGLKPTIQERPRPSNDRISKLKIRLKYIEYQHSKRNIHDSDYDKAIVELKQEMDSLLKEEAKMELLRRIPLYSSRVTNFKFYCGTCYDKAYYRRGRRY